MRILSINCGSSSVKAALLDTAGVRLLDVRAVQLGTDASELHIDRGATPLGPGLGRNEVLERVLAAVARHPAASGITGVAHRIVHGGAVFLAPAVLDDASVRQLAALDELAPLHNPPALQGVAAARRAFPSVPHVGVFDTTFHATLPRRAREYALPPDLVAAHGIRRYGFHGISHAHVADSVARHLHTEPQALRVISCHLGNGASVTAIEYGRSIDTSMGMTPLEGLVMGTRAGDLDPGILLHLQRSGGFAPDALEELLNQASGLKGMTGTENMEQIEQRAAAGDDACRLAIALFAHRVRKYIGAHAVAMGGVDVIAFTGGIGEHSAVIRHRIAQRLEFLGALLDEDLNRDVRLTSRLPVQEISAPHSRTRIVVVQADEEAAMAAAAVRLLSGQSRGPSLPPIPIAISARHAHLSQATIDRLFGLGHVLSPAKALSQPGQFAARESVALVGPRGRLDAVRVLGPPRARDQVEISRSDEFILGIDAPVRISGDIDNSPGIALEGPEGRVVLGSGVICARRHIHMHPDDALRFGVRDHDTLAVRIDSDSRDLTFGDVTVRVSPDYRLEMHIDVDEANAAGLVPGDAGEILTPTRAYAMHFPQP